ncbi:MAG TPA: SMP-30/gluconolactonase/LRE family protein [Gammaproteobacteria bacterium]|nr:SMP-30/gluconolactonase/LRE family protein [Gammaproteobacteria bacterium]
MATYQTSKLVDGFVFLEGPRWHQGKLWVSDMWDYTVYTVTASGARERVCKVDERPSGLGFAKDGSLLIVSMANRSLLRYANGKLERLADLSPWATGDCNDMVTDAQGRCYVGNFGYDLLAGAAPATAKLVCVEPDGRARSVADGLNFPNGAVIMNGGRTLVVAETFGHCLTAFDVAADGSLSNRRCFAALGEHTPDGICLDKDGGIWVASFMTDVFLRVKDGGAVTDTVPVGGRRAVACQLGGDDGRTLFCLTYDGTIDDLHHHKPGAVIETVRVEHAAAGSP